ncbi:hypothetical protein BP6252_09748 [Coleophoma cylindrospora]|uniref:Uncharacterized protein n=1 Tax=Coleophoma cylindrospora TaxID=1849047 RepID=A0A3D8QWA3_9HELO|nr:hypothetical protein BP6252_09748 [Coleophoma cylindrospora]
MTLGPQWPTGVPGYTPDSVETSKELVHGQAFVQSGQLFEGSLPLPVAAPSGNETGNPNVVATPNLVAVIAAKTFTTNSPASIVLFDHTTIIDLTVNVTGSNLSWTAPSDETYVLVAIYGRGTGQVQNLYDSAPNAPEVTDPSPAYIVDHFSKAGIDASVKFWNDHLLTPELRSLLNRYQHIFRGFERGYFRDDFRSTITDLYTDYRIAGLKKFANDMGLALHLQPYTAIFDASYTARVLAIPEGESFAFEADPDAFRILAAGRDVGGRTTILSDELGAYVDQSYGATWSFLIGPANLNFALGVSQVVIHGYPYKKSPTCVWPGFSPFTPLGISRRINGFADAWGPRQPQWMFAKSPSFYLANSQTLLQSGKAAVDLAILNTDEGITATWADLGLDSAGYSYQLPSPNLLMKHGATVSNGRLAASGPAYKAIIINNLTALDLDASHEVLSYAKSGLPVNCGGYSNHYPDIFRRINNPEQTSSVNFNEILSFNTTKLVEKESEAAASLQSLGGSCPQPPYFQKQFSNRSFGEGEDVNAFSSPNNYEYPPQRYWGPRPPEREWSQQPQYMQDQRTTDGPGAYDRRQTQALYALPPYDTSSQPRGFSENDLLAGLS